ncbi:MAG: hypothetical protein M3R15_06940 [Acidobacteriota bacterium]|nr:hypothetical protein [Acidobacteriota bacterium]
MLKIQHLYLAVVFVCTSAVLTAAQECSLKPEQAPVVRGFRLGMTTEEVREKVAGAGGLDKADELGMTETTIYPFQLKSKDDAQGLQYVRLSFLDRRLTDIELRYDGSTDWDGVDQFAAKVSESLQLPKMGRGRFGVLNRRVRTLECGGFRVQAMLIEDDRGALTLTEGGVKEIIEKRKAEAKEKQRQTFKP